MKRNAARATYRSLSEFIELLAFEEMSRAGGAGQWGMVAQGLEPRTSAV